MTSASAQTAAPVPRLVVTVMIDQLRSDYLDAFSPLYGEGGFARLLKDGRVYEGAQYPVAQVDRASSIATMFTGAVPYDHGVVGEQWLDRSTLRPVYCVDDAAFKGWNTTETTSPKNLAVSTISDELKVATDGKALVYSIAPYRDAAVLAAGHAA
ncbi:MAG: alkaline phosphatase family protein, partial [Bacteroidales bacterium]|nr:alkaline phosphatase family protein [Candidatus Minthousia equi]